ncbi:MAG TPA: T9SS type A sorting domain-containing protein [Bacteroidota bacterium]|nr:T9SS type A sorting domain-containing protein [Bacteroidota bacterium]
MNRRSCCYCVLVCLHLSFSSLSPGQGKYTVDDIGTLGGATAGFAVNDSGWVAGYSYVSGVAHAFLYRHGFMTDLGVLGAVSSGGQTTETHGTDPVAGRSGGRREVMGGGGSRALGLDNAGRVVGNSSLSGNIEGHAFLYDAGVMTDIGTLVGSTGVSVAAAINDSGIIVGYSDAGTGRHAFIYRNGNMSDLGTLGYVYSFAYGVNKSGSITGISTRADSINTAFLYQNGTMTDIGAIGGWYTSGAFGINSAGHIVGSFNLPVSGQHAFVYRDGTVKDLGALGSESVGRAINDSDQIAGWTYVSPSDAIHAVLWEADSLRDLNSCIDTASGWTLEYAYGINNRGQIVGSGLHNGQPRAFLLTPRRWPVLLVPGIGATYPADQNDIGPWMFTRGIQPSGLQIDPLAHAYDDLIQTLKNAGYVEGKDLFIVNYDWRIPPGPFDGVFDGVVNGISAASLTDSTFSYAVDYLGFYLRQAMDAWEADHPGSILDSVNIIAHSTGGLVARTYIQSPACGGTFAGGRRLPRVENLIMVGVPNRGASKAWNPLHDNWGVDITFQLVLSKILNLGYQKVLAGGIITGPDIDISLSSLAGPVCQDSPQICFVHQYNPTARSLLATYDFIDFGAGFTNVNGDTSSRNNLLLDLNAGLDLSLAGDPNAFADSSHVSVIYATNVATPTAVVKKVGPSGNPNVIVPFSSFVTRDARPGETWYQDIVAPSSGDGTVPLESSSGQFIGDPRVHLFPFAKGTNTSGDVSHLGLMFNADVQQQILNILGVRLPPEKISTTKHSAFAALMSTAGNVAANIIGGSLLGLILDPLEGFVVDANGKRLGYSVAAGPLAEIPGSTWFGDSAGIGWIMEPTAFPASLHLTGLGGAYYSMVSVIDSSGSTGVIDQGVLGAGATRVIPIPSGVTSVRELKPFQKPAVFGLAQNYPNPFNPATTIRFQIPDAGWVTLTVYTVLGTEVTRLVNGELRAGEYAVTWDASALPSGVYFSRLTSGSHTQTRKLLLLR